MFKLILEDSERGTEFLLSNASDNRHTKETPRVKIHPQASVMPSTALLIANVPYRLDCTTLFDNFKESSVYDAQVSLSGTPIAAMMAREAFVEHGVSVPLDGLETHPDVRSRSELAIIHNETRSYVSCTINP